MTITIKVDSREPKEMIRNARAYFPEAIVCKLDSADAAYFNGGGTPILGVERKELYDFIKSVHTGRIFRQAIRMRQYYPYSYIFLEGDMAQRDKIRYKTLDVNGSDFNAAVASLTVRYGCPVISVQNNIDFWERFWFFVEKVEDNRPLRPLDKEIEKGSTSDESMLMAGVEGIGRKKAEMICAKYSIHDLYHISLDELLQFNGIGPKLGKSIKEVFPCSVENKIHFKK